MNKKEIDNKKLFQSYDLALVAYLLYQGSELEKIERHSPNKALFVIRRKDGLEKEISKFWNLNTKVDAQTYFNHLKCLKNQIFSSK